MLVYKNSLLKKLVAGQAVDVQALNAMTPKKY